MCIGYVSHEDLINSFIEKFKLNPLPSWADYLVVEKSLSPNVLQPGKSKDIETVWFKIENQTLVKIEKPSQYKGMTAFSM